MRDGLVIDSNLQILELTKPVILREVFGELKVLISSISPNVYYFLKKEMVTASDAPDAADSDPLSQKVAEHSKFFYEYFKTYCE